MKFFQTTIFSLMLVISQAAYAENKTVESIAVVDVPLIMNDSLAAKDIKAQIDKKRNDFQAEITKKEDKLREEDKKLSEQKNVLSKDEFEKKVQEFQAKVNEVQRQVQTRRAQLEDGYGRAIQQLQDTILEVVGEIGKEKGFLVALPSNQILYTKDSLNITTEVMEKLNKKLPKVAVKLEDGAPSSGEVKKESKKDKKK